MKGVIKGLIIGLVIAIIGVAVLIIAVGMNGWKPLPNETDFEMQTFTADENHSAIVFDVDARGVKTEFYDGEKIAVEYPNAKGFNTSFKESGETLKITSKTKWYSFISCIGSHSVNVPIITVKLPYGVYDITIDMDAGSFTLADGEYGKILLDMDAGAFTAETIICASFECDIDAGAVKVSSLECTQTLKCDIDAGKLDILKLKSPQTTADVDAGAANLNFAGAQSDYTITVRKSAGSCNVSNQQGNTENKINIEVDAGSVTVNFNN